MPLIVSKFKCPKILRNAHVQTILPNLFRNVNLEYARERIILPDSDFLDLDWAQSGNKKLLMICHGLEGSSQSVYVKGLIKTAGMSNWDSLAINYRGCSGNPNKFLHSYHSGATEDIHFLMNYLENHYSYQEIALVGFSLGGNLVLKYMGEMGNKLQVTRCVAISVPCDLSASATKLKRASNLIYLRRFLKRLKEKVNNKKHLLTEELSLEEILRSKNFHEFDDLFTAPVNGFKNAEDYWERNSCIHFLKTISTPTLLLNADDDPFLTKECFPIKEAEVSNNLYLEVTRGGGHVGFMEFNGNLTYWAEKRIMEFLEN